MSQPHKTFPKRMELSRQQRSFRKGFVRLIGANSETKKPPACLLCLQTVLMAAASALWFSLWVYLPDWTRDNFITCSKGREEHPDTKDTARIVSKFVSPESFKGGSKQTIWLVWLHRLIKANSLICPINQHRFRLTKVPYSFLSAVSFYLGPPVYDRNSFRQN